jgi:hypothetical protein
MHCPDCGTRATANQKFCRSCGFSLEKVAQLLAGQSSLPASSQISDNNSAGYVSKQREKLTGRNPQGPIRSPHTETTNPLPLAASADSPASVTEHTTARLEERTRTAS